AELLAALRSRGIPASGSGGGSLRDAAAVNAVLEFLRFCDQPDHTIAAFHVARSPLGPVVGLEWRGTAAHRAEVAAVWRQRLVVHGYASVLEELGAAVDADCSAGDRRRWRRLLDEADRLDRLGWMRPLAFVEAAEAVRIGEGSAAAVVVLNIHQSKGLEFDAVICPDLEHDLKPRTDVLVSRDAAGGIRRIARRMRGLDHLPALAAVRDETDAMQVRESLCGLYVAMTRARDRLDLLVDAPKANEKTIPATAAGLLRSALAPEATEIGVVWRSGEASEAPPSNEPDGPGRLAETVEPIASSTGEESARRRFAFARGGGRTRRAAPPSTHAPDSLGHLFTIGESTADAADRGTAIHALFEQIGFVEDGVPEDAALDRAIRRVLPRRPAPWRTERIAEFRAMLSTPAIAAALARPADGPARVWRERRFVSADGGAVRQGIIDRLVVVGEPDGWRRAEILDFKTDAFDGAVPIEEILSDKVDRYRDQMIAYREEVAGQFGMASGVIETTLLFLDLGVVRTADET
ncbi:MAG: 3'-5' exonuclease, partial [Planctomycetota bacterium]